MPRRTPSASGKAPPESEVPAPRGTTLILFARAIAHHLLNLRRRLRQHGHHGRLTVSGEPVGFEGPQFLLMVDHAFARNDPPERFDNLGAAAQDAAIRFGHGDHGALLSVRTIPWEQILRVRAKA